MAPDFSSCRREEAKGEKATGKLWQRTGLGKGTAFSRAASLPYIPALAAEVRYTCTIRTTAQTHNPPQLSSNGMDAGDYRLSASDGAKTERYSGTRPSEDYRYSPLLQRLRPRRFFPQPNVVSLQFAIQRSPTNPKHLPGQRFVAVYFHENALDGGAFDVLQIGCGVA